VPYALVAHATGLLGKLGLRRRYRAAPCPHRHPQPGAVLLESHRHRADCLEREGSARPRKIQSRVTSQMGRTRPSLSQRLNGRQPSAALPHPPCQWSIACAKVCDAPPHRCTTTEGRSCASSSSFGRTNPRRRRTRHPSYRVEASSTRPTSVRSAAGLCRWVRCSTPPIPTQAGRTSATKED
jgi:hypothetical protein